MKKLVSILLSIVMVACMMSACNNEKPDDNFATIVTGEATVAKHSAAVYPIDNWREDAEDGSRTYYTTLLIYSDNFYGAPTIEDIKYKTDNGYENLIDVIEGSSVTIYDINNQPVNGICTYVKIKTHALVDTKKIYAYLSGPSEYNPETLTIDKYKEVHGSTDGWVEMLSSVTTKSAPSDDVARLQTDIYSGVIRLYDDNSSLFYYNSNNANPIVDGNTRLTKIDVDKLKDSPEESLILDLKENGTVAKIVDGKVEIVDLDERLKITGKIVDGEVFLGFETVDGSDFGEYDGEIPDAIVYDTLRQYTFVVG